MNEYNNLKSGTEEARRSEKGTDSIIGTQNNEGDSNQEGSFLLNTEGESAQVIDYEERNSVKASSR
jgi:hypothetical protein|tara:strand:- start:401 stop:598 length:198 start_codon:yes stop_codon:yes gene_type:complete